MKPIELTEEQVQVIEDQLAGRFDFYTISERQRDVLSCIIDDAEALMRELNAYDELGDDLIKWYYDKYKNQ